MNRNPQFVTQFVEQLPPGTPQLGSLIWYSIRDTLIPHGVVATEMVKAGLGPIPPEPQDRKTFQRVTGTGRNRKSVPIATKAGEVTARRNYMVRRSESAKVIVATIVAETISLRSDDTVDLDYEPSATVKWHHNDPANLEIDTTNADDVIKEIVADIAADYANEVGRVNSYGIREWIRGYLGRDCDATIVRPSGGVYFVSETYNDRLTRLAQLVDGLNADPHCDITLHALPLIDSEQQRRMVQEAFVDESQGALEDILAELSDIGQSKVKERRRERILGDYTEVLGRVKSYRKLLGDNLDMLDSTLKVVQTGIAHLATA